MREVATGEQSRAETEEESRTWKRQERPAKG